jgi:hypothetical protein
MDSFLVWLRTNRPTQLDCRINPAVVSQILSQLRMVGALPTLLEVAATRSEIAMFVTLGARNVLHRRHPLAGLLLIVYLVELAPLLHGLERWDQSRFVVPNSLEHQAVIETVLTSEGQIRI